MGQHKHNPNAIAAAKGELPPKQKPMGKRESELLMQNLVVAKIIETNPALGGLLCSMRSYY